MTVKLGPMVLGPMKLVVLPPATAFIAAADAPDAAAAPALPACIICIIKGIICSIICTIEAVSVFEVSGRIAGGADAEEALMVGRWWVDESMSGDREEVKRRAME